MNKGNKKKYAKKKELWLEIGRKWKNVGDETQSSYSIVVAGMWEFPSHSFQVDYHRLVRSCIFSKFITK